MTRGLTLTPLTGIKLVEPGDDLAQIALEAFAANEVTPQDNDVLVLAQKIVSKAEGRYAELGDQTPSAAAISLAAETDKDARLIEIILGESKRVVRRRPGLLIMEHKLGFVMANAGVDHSNITHPGADERVLLLPCDPDRSASALHERLRAATGKHIAVVINDSFGRPWRKGVCGIALGAAGLPAVIDKRGAPDLFGRILLVTEIGFADEIAAAASLVMGQANEAVPMVLVRGLCWDAPEAPVAAMVRPVEHDLFR